MTRVSNNNTVGDQIGDNRSGIAFNVKEDRAGSCVPCSIVGRHCNRMCSRRNTRQVGWAERFDRYAIVNGVRILSYTAW